VVALDILIRLDHAAYALELKYLKRRLAATVDGEQRRTSETTVGGFAQTRYASAVHSERARDLAQ
jgi:hypothetical protein